MIKEQEKFNLGIHKKGALVDIEQIGDFFVNRIMSKTISESKALDDYQKEKLINEINFALENEDFSFVQVFDYPNLK